MNGLEKSDLPIVAGKLANGAALAAKESVERRGGTRENVDLQNTVRTQSREAVSRAQARIREALTRNKTGGKPPGPPCPRAPRSVSSACLSPTIHSEGGWPATTARHCRIGGQSRPGGGGDAPDASLRGGVPGV